MSERARPDSSQPEPPTAKSVEARVADALERTGLVLTVQRRAIWKALEPRTDHPTADGVFEALGGVDSGISRTTVYRTLEAFVRAGLAQRAGHLGPAVRYDPRTGPHHHLVCEACGAVRDVEDAVLADAQAAAIDGLQGAELAGFRALEASLLIRGTCPECSEGA